jgi:hypothetical protein
VPILKRILKNSLDFKKILKNSLDETDSTTTAIWNFDYYFTREKYSLELVVVESFFFKRTLKNFLELKSREFLRILLI